MKTKLWRRLQVAARTQTIGRILLIRQHRSRRHPEECQSIAGPHDTGHCEVAGAAGLLQDRERTGKRWEPCTHKHFVWRERSLINASKELLGGNSSPAEHRLNIQMA